MAWNRLYHTAICVLAGLLGATIYFFLSFVFWIPGAVLVGVSDKHDSSDGKYLAGVILFGLACMWALLGCFYGMFNYVAIAVSDAEDKAAEEERRIRSAARQHPVAVVVVDSTEPAPPYSDK